MQSVPTTPTTPPGPSRALAPAFALAIFGLTLAAYLPALNGAVLWDDASHITARGLQEWAGLWKIWFRLGTTQQYYPVLHSAFWLEHRLWGDSVLGYHLLNVGLHATSACLFALVLSRIRTEKGPLRAPGGAEWLAAALFALHPVCVESVAWISEQKNTLSLVFYLLSALAYLRFDRGRRWGSYAGALGLFVLALLSKSVTATLPGALLLVLAWRNRGLSWRRDVAPLIPWFVVGACSGLFTAWVERAYIGARGEAFDLGIASRCFLAGRIVWFYLWKLVWPADLAFIYPRWHVGSDWTWMLGFLGVVAAVAFLSWSRRWGRAPLVAFLFFLGSVFPALGFFNVYPFIFSYVADHWQYLPCLGIIGLVAEGGAGFARRMVGGLAGSRRRLATGASLAAAGALLAVLFVLTRRQCELYRDNGTLYSDTLSKNPGCWMAHSNLGVFLMDRGSLDGAIAHLQEAVRIKPDYSDAHNNLGNALSKVAGRSVEAISEYETALRLEPGMTQAHANLGRALADIPGRLEEGIGQMQAALMGNADNPEYADLHADLGTALGKVPGRLPEAISEFVTALRLKPDAVGAMNALGIALYRAGRTQESVGLFQRILAIHPENPEAHNNLANVLSQLGRDPEAVEEYRAALHLNPGSVEAHFNLGRALRNVGDGHEAVAEYREALRLAPRSAEIRNSLGSVLYLQGRTLEALAEFQEAMRLQPGSAPFRNNLGMALTRAGRLDEAISQLRRAVELAPGYSDAHYNLGLALQKAGREQDAASEFSASGRPRP